MKKILIITPGNETYGEMFSSVLERNSRDVLGDFQIYRMSYPPPLRANYFSSSMTNYCGQHKVDAIFFGGVADELPELIQLLKNHNIQLPVYVSDDIIGNEIQNINAADLKLFLPEAEVPVGSAKWLELFVKRYKTQPSCHAKLGAETMFAMSGKHNNLTYTPESFVKAMEQSSQELNKKINVKIIRFHSSKQ